MTSARSVTGVGAAEVPVAGMLTSTPRHAASQVSLATPTVVPLLRSSSSVMMRKEITSTSVIMPKEMTRDLKIIACPQSTDLKVIACSPGPVDDMARSSSFIMSSKPRTTGPNIAFQWFAPWKGNKATQVQGMSPRTKARSFEALRSPQEASTDGTRGQGKTLRNDSPRSSKGSAADDDNSDSDYDSGCGEPGEPPLPKMGSPKSLVMIVCVGLVFIALGASCVTGYMYPDLESPVPKSRGHGAPLSRSVAPTAAAGTNFLQAASTPEPSIVKDEAPVANKASPLSLTSRYMQFRMANDVTSLQKLLSDDAELHVDLSQAGMLVSMRINQALGFKKDLHGPEAIAGYYRGLPTESGDKSPDPKSFKCSGTTCTVTCTVSRPVVGEVTDVADLQWDVESGLLKKVDLAFSV